MDKIIEVNFEEWQDKQYDESLKQWDQGQHLEISGLNILDEIVEVHFSLQETNGTAKRMLGTVKDGIIHVDIPAFILEGPEYCYENMRNYSAWAWVYLSDEESAETIRKIEFIIETRPKPEEYVTPEELSFLQQLEEAIKNKITTPSSAKVGQLLRVKEVDENGKPTEFDVVDKSEVGGDIKVDAELSKESKNPVENQVVAKEFIKFGGTVEVTSEEPKKENTVLTIDPSSEEVILYTAEEVDELLAEKVDKELWEHFTTHIASGEDNGMAYYNAMKCKEARIVGTGLKTDFVGANINIIFRTESRLTSADHRQLVLGNVLAKADTAYNLEVCIRRIEKNHVLMEAYISLDKNVQTISDFHTYYRYVYDIDEVAENIATLGMYLGGTATLTGGTIDFYTRGVIE